MNRRHVAIISVPVPALVNPTFAIVAALVRHGYHVTYVTAQRFAPEVAALGAEVLLCPHIEFPFDQDTSEALPIEAQYSVDLIDLATRTLAQVWPFYQQNRPDFVLYDAIACAGPVVARRSGVPMVRMSTQFAYNDETLELPLIPDAWRLKQRELQRVSALFFHEHGIPGNPTFSTNEPTIYFYTRDVQLGQPEANPNALYAGRCAAERPRRERWESHEGEATRSVLISASTVYDQGPQYYSACLAALSQLRCHVVLAIGPYNDAARFLPLPPNCEIVQRIPLVTLLPEMDLIICSGGMATTMESMYHGVPILMLSHGEAELEAYAQNVENHGLGRHLRQAEATIENLSRHAVEMLEDRVLSQAVERMQAEVRASAGGEEVVRWLEARGLNRTD